ncbi:hypothetical protein N7533_007647 [Penicillium manginii]|uniref:uncharacterized protein n=1 Tax=Penicillium manginii TaxID=203109 RepID=UPI002548604C|nr:uncharacterized protein N7533_007647 [Penicillium manginii]KAJ5750619.1 hypothetical protein N7533_007647 [Penicillium manginii]
MVNEFSLQPTPSISGFTGTQLGTSMDLASSLVVFTSTLTETIHPFLTYTEQTTVSDDPVTQFVISHLVTTTNLETVQSVTVTFTTLPQSHFPETPWSESTQSETKLESILGTTFQTSPLTLTTSSAPSWTTSATTSSTNSESLSQLETPLVGSTGLNTHPSEWPNTHLSPNTHPSEGTAITLVSLAPTSISQTSQIAGTAMATHSLSQISMARSDSGLPMSITQASSTVPWVRSSALSWEEWHSYFWPYWHAFFFVRRRRRNILHRRLHSRQALLRSDSDNSAHAFLDGHNRQSSWPVDHASATTPSDHFPPAQNHSNTATRPNYGLSAANRKLALDENIPYGSHRHSIEGPWAWWNGKPKIEVSPPSRSASIYSRQSWEDRLESLEFYHNGEFTTPGGNTTYHHGASTAAIPDQASKSARSSIKNLAHETLGGRTATVNSPQSFESALAWSCVGTAPGGGSTETLSAQGYETPTSKPKHLATPKRRASIRSNPFDLEFPPSVASKGVDPTSQISLPPTEFPTSASGGRY